MDQQKAATAETSNTTASPAASSATKTTGDTSSSVFKPNAEKMKQLADHAHNVKIGGKGTPRRKIKNIRRPPNADDKKLQGSLKKLAANAIQGIEEVNMFKDNGEVIQFANPKVQASLGSNTFAISGPSENKTLQEMLPSMLASFNMNADTNMAAEFRRQAKMQPAKGDSLGAGEQLPADDEDVPDLVENFDDIKE